MVKSFTVAMLVLLFLGSARAQVQPWVLLFPAAVQDQIKERALRLKEWVIQGEHENEIECEIFRRRVMEISAVTGDGGTAAAFALGLCAPRADVENQRS